jgi:hypothetical protein
MIKIITDEELETWDPYEQQYVFQGLWAEKRIILIIKLEDFEDYIEKQFSISSDNLTEKPLAGETVEKLEKIFSSTPTDLVTVSGSEHPRIYYQPLKKYSHEQLVI